MVDRCSTANYIVHSVAEHLGATQVGYCATPINVMGGSRVSEGPICEFKIDLTNGEQVNIVAQVVPTILPNMDTAQYQEAVDSVLSIYPNLNLPKFTGDTMEVHILLAGDIANELSGRDIIKIGKKLEVRSSLVGPSYIQGSLDDHSAGGTNGNVTKMAPQMVSPLLTRFAPFT